MLHSSQNSQMQKVNISNTVHILSIFTIVVLIGFCLHFANADTSSSSVGVSAERPSFKYQEIKELAKKLGNQSSPEELKKLVERSSDFIETFPEYKRVDQIYYYLGNGLVRLGRVQEGIDVFEKFTKAHPDARWAAPSLFELGLAYDKLSKHGKADEVYKKLIDHPKFGSQSYPTQAKKVLEQDVASRKRKLAKPQGISSKPSEWVGKPAPDFRVKDLEGKELSLKKYRGHVVLLDFWATWYGPCIVELPNVMHTYEKFKDQKFQIIGISLDRSKPALDAFIEKEGLAWIHYWDHDQKLTHQYGVQGIPSMFLIDSNGIIQKANLRGQALETAVAKLVKGNLAKPIDTPTKKPESSSPPQSIPATKLIKRETNTPKDASPLSLAAKMKTWIGKPAPDFRVKDVNDKEVTLKDYRGQVVLLDFWATWCGPCIAEMPKVKKTYEKFKDQKFQIIGISLDRAKQRLEEYIEKEQLAWVHYWDEDRKIRTQYGVRGIPTAFLIDGNSIIRKASLGGFDVETAVAELVKENLAKPTDTSPSEKPPSDPLTEGQLINPKAKEIIDAAVAAHGGLEKLQSVKNIVMEFRNFEHFPDGEVQDEGSTKVYCYPNKFRSDWNVNDETDSLIFDGDTLIQLTNGVVQPVPQKNIESFINVLKDGLFREPVWLLLKLSQNEIPIKYLGTEEVRGVPASVLLITQPSGRDLKVYISDKTHYVVQFNYSAKMGKVAENMLVSFDNYRDVDGVKIAHSRTTENGEYRQMLITDIKLNAEIDEALFRPTGLNE